jgi:solute carrier family 8 (sodium/calcium exchanger)
VFFACIPPTNYYGGWLAFYTALLFIGIVTAVVGELAETFGCIVGLKDSVTAITFVAMGTSLPDTFASKVAAQESPVADAAIGNVTGSNAVNVFLGLGIPWTMAAVYAEVGDKGDYISRSCGFGLSVGTYCVCAVLAVAVLTVRS